jgi:hypothetical protein
MPANYISKCDPMLMKLKGQFKIVKVSKYLLTSDSNQGTVHTVGFLFFVSLVWSKKNHGRYI